MFLWKNDRLNVSWYMSLTYLFSLDYSDQVHGVSVADLGSKTNRIIDYAKLQYQIHVPRYNKQENSLIQFSIKNAPSNLYFRYNTQSLIANYFPYKTLFKQRHNYFAIFCWTDFERCQESMTLKTRALIH